MFKSLPLLEAAQLFSLFQLVQKHYAAYRSQIIISTTVDAAAGSTDFRRIPRLWSVRTWHRIDNLCKKTTHLMQIFFSDGLLTFQIIEKALYKPRRYASCSHIRSHSASPHIGPWNYLQMHLRIWKWQDGSDKFAAPVSKQHNMSRIEFWLFIRWTLYMTICPRIHTPFLQIMDFGYLILKNSVTRAVMVARHIFRIFHFWNSFCKHFHKFKMQQLLSVLSDVRATFINAAMVRDARFDRKYVRNELRHYEETLPKKIRKRYWDDLHWFYNYL